VRFAPIYTLWKSLISSRWRISNKYNWKDINNLGFYFPCNEKIKIFFFGDVYKWVITQRFGWWRILAVWMYMNKKWCDEESEKSWEACMHAMFETWCTLKSHEIERFIVLSRLLVKKKQCLSWCCNWLRWIEVVTWHAHINNSVCQCDIILWFILCMYCLLFYTILYSYVRFLLDCRSWIGYRECRSFHAIKDI